MEQLSHPLLLLRSHFFVIAPSLLAGVQTQHLDVICKHRTSELCPQALAHWLLIYVVYSYSELRSLPRIANSFLLARNQRREMYVRSSNMNHSEAQSQPLIMCVWIVWVRCAAPGWLLLHTTFFCLASQGQSRWLCPFFQGWLHCPSLKKAVSLVIEVQCRIFSTGLEDFSQ